MVETPEFKVTQSQHSNTIFTVLLMEPNEVLLRSLQYVKPLLTGLTINTTFTMARFQASSVITLNEYKTKNKVTYESTLYLIKSLTRQLTYLTNKLNHTFYKYNPENVLVIDSTQFVYISSIDLMPLECDKTIRFEYPFKKSSFAAPEILNIDTLPINVCNKSSYYSLGILTIYFFLSCVPISELEINEVLLPIKETGLYWFILKALNKIPSKRVLLFI